MLNSPTTLTRTNNHDIVILNREITCKSHIKNPFRNKKKEITNNLIDIFLIILQVATANHLIPRLRRIRDKRKEQSRLRWLQINSMKWLIRHYTIRNLKSVFLSIAISD